MKSALQAIGNNREVKMIEKDVESILEEYGNQIRDIIKTPGTPLIMVVARAIRARNKFTQQICQLEKDKPKPEGRLLAIDEELVEKCMPTLERFEVVEKQVFFPIPKPPEFSCTIRIYAATMSREAVRKTLNKTASIEEIEKRDKRIKELQDTCNQWVQLTKDIFTDHQEEIERTLEKMTELSDELLEIGRKAIEDALIERRDNCIFELNRANGLVVWDKDGSNSSMIRFGPETALKIGMKAIGQAIKEAKEEGEEEL